MSHAHRPVSSDDADELRAFVAGIRPSDRTFLDDQLLDPDSVAAWATDPGAAGLVAVTGSRIVGVGSLRPGSGWTSHVGLLRVVVGEAERGRGVGRTLVLALLGVAADRGVAKVVVEVMAANVAAARLFERLGFVPEATLRDHVRDARGDYQDLTVLATWIDHQGQPVAPGEEIAG